MANYVDPDQAAVLSGSALFFSQICVSSQYLDFLVGSCGSILIVGWMTCNFTCFSTLARGYKTFFMLNSVEHKIFPAHKC